MQTFEQIIKVFLYEAGRMWWFTLLGITLAALIKTYQLDRHVRAYIGKWGIWAIPVAVLIGALSPLCSCGILPIVIPLALTGVPLPPIFALLATSPTMDPTSFFLTWGALGPELAWWKLGGSLFLGLLAGGVAYFFERTSIFSGNLVRLKPVYNENGELASAYDIGFANGVVLKTMIVKPRESKLRFFFDRFRDVAIFVVPLVLAAIAIEAVIQVLTPMSWVVALAGQKGLASLVFASLVGLPLPLHQVPVVPILAGLIAKGMAVGPDIALLMAGPVTSIPAIIALWAIFLPRVVITFLCTVLGGSLLLGALRMALY